MPRRAIESIENEIRSLSRRIDDTRQSGIDGQALAGIERAFGEIREVLRSLTPAEQLAGYDEAIRNLGAKLDLILRASDDPSTIHQLEGAIAALRSIVSNVASNDALVRLSDDVRLLSSKVDQLGQFESHGDSFAVLEQRIAALTSSLESRERPVVSDNSEHIEGALRALMDRLDHMPVGNDSASAFAHLEQRVSYLLERLEASSDHRSGNLGRVEEGLQDVLRHLETQHANFAALTASSQNAVAAPDSGLVDIVKRELSDIRFSQSETDRRTQDSLETVHNTLGHVVDRLAMIEGDLRAVRSAPVAPAAPQWPTPPAPQPAPPQAVATRAAMPPQPKPELPNPAAAQPHFAAAPREFHAAQPVMPAAAVAPKAISEILEPHAAPPRAAIEPELPPDHPLEPGTRPTGRTASPSERIAASENAISEISPGPKEPVSATNFIAAARRAAQAAAAAPPAGKAARGPQKDTARDKAKGTLDDHLQDPLAAGRRERGRHRARHVQDGDDAARQRQPAATACHREFRRTAAGSTARGRKTGDAGSGDAFDDIADPDRPAIVQWLRAERLRRHRVGPDPADRTPFRPLRSRPSARSPARSRSHRRPAATNSRLVQIPPTERLPDAIGGPVLRAAALKGDPAAAYEIGVRFAEGKGVAVEFRRGREMV